MATKNTEVTWTFIKNLVDVIGIKLHFTENDNEYAIFALNGQIKYDTAIFKNSSALIALEDQVQNDADKVDFETNYKAGANTLEKMFVEATFAANSEITVAGGTQKIFKHKLVRWNAGNIIVGTSWVDAWTITGPSCFYGAIFQLNTDKMDMRVVIDGDIVIDIDLKEIKNDFVLKGGGEGDDSDSKATAGSRAIGCIGIWEYDNKRWAYCPPTAIKIVVDMKIQFRSHSGNKKIFRALSSLAE